MVSPNIGKIDKKMAIIYGIDNYDGKDQYSVTITTTATIFKDATWPRSNATLSGSISFTGINGKF